MLSQPEIDRILAEHVKLGPQKPLSYLPLNTVTQHLGMTSQSYVAEIHRRDGVAVEFSAVECPIYSGAIFAFHHPSLQNILDQNRDLLESRNWPTDAAAFVERVAGAWLNNDDPVLPIVNMAFGD